MGKIKFDYSNAKDFIRDHEIDMIEKQVSDAKEYLLSRKGPGNDFLGWIDLPVDYDKEEFVRIKKLLTRLRAIPMYWLSLGSEDPTLVPEP